jgi:serine/threonine protein kinase
VQAFNGWLREVAKGLLLAVRLVHKASIIHLDIRPANVVWVGDIATGHVVLVDWGVSQRVGERIHDLVGVVEFAATQILKLAKSASAKGAPVDALVAPSISAQASLDLESLGYTMLDIAAGGKRLWGPYHVSRAKLDSFITNRNAFVTQTFPVESPYRRLTSPRYAVAVEDIFFPEGLASLVAPENVPEDDFESGGAAGGGGRADSGSEDA